MISLNPETSLGALVENQFSDHYLISVNRRTFEKIDYKTRFNQEFKKTFDKKHTLYIIVGTDSGMMVKQLLKTPPEKGSTYLFIEFPEIIELTKDLYSLGEHKRIIISTENQWEEIAEKIGMPIYFKINKVKIIKSFAAQYYYINEYLLLLKALEDKVRQLSWQYQQHLDSMIFIQRQLENLAEDHTPAVILKNKFRNKSALILAGGPSLDNYIDWIEKNQQFYVVIAVSRIAKRLLQTNIKPDIFVSIDPKPISFEVCKEMLLFEQESLFINNSHVSPMLLGNWLGVNLFLGNLFPWNTRLNTENLVGAGPTVTNTAIFTAIQLGIKQQILFGVDLCYSQEGYSHASGSNEYAGGPNINLLGQSVETNTGQKAETTSAFYEAIAGIEFLAQLAKESNGQLITLSANSAKMKNVSYVFPSELIIPKEKFSISDFLQKQFQLIETPKYKQTHYEKIIPELKNALIKVEKIKEMACRGLEYNKKLFAGNNPSKNFNFKLKMDKLEKELNHKKLVDYSSLSKTFGAIEFLSFLTPDSDQEWTDIEIKESADTYYRALKTGAIELAKHIFSAINRTEIRLLENNQLKINNDMIKRHIGSFKKNSLLDNINIKEEIVNNTKYLMKTYLEGDERLGKNSHEIIQTLSFLMMILQIGADLQSRRLLIFLKRNPKLFNIPDHIIIFDNPEINNDFFSRTVKDIKEGHRKTYQLWFSPENTIDTSTIDTAKFNGLDIKLYDLFLLKDLQSINKIIKGLNLLNPSYPERKAYIHLAQGYCYELEGKDNQAIKEYGFVDSPGSTESALKRLLLIALKRNELEFARNILEVLSDISPDYLTQLGDLYMITKNYRDALDIYSQYLNYNAFDIGVLLKIGQLYETQNIFDGAQFIYNKILELDPDNQMAKTHLSKLEAN